MKDIITYFARSIGLLPKDKLVPSMPRQVQVLLSRELFARGGRVAGRCETIHNTGKRKRAKVSAQNVIRERSLIQQVHSAPIAILDCLAARQENVQRVQMVGCKRKRAKVSAQSATREKPKAATYKKINPKSDKIIYNMLIL